MTNGQYPPSLLGHQGLQHSPATPVIRTMDMSNTNNRTMELSNSGSYQQLSNSPSPRDGNSPPGLHVPNGHGSHSSKVNIKQPNPCCHKILSHLLIFYMACPDNLPFRLAGSLSSWLSTLTLSTGATTCGDEAESASAGNFWDLRRESEVNYPAVSPPCWIPAQGSHVQRHSSHHHVRPWLPASYGYFHHGEFKIFDSPFWLSLFNAFLTTFLLQAPSQIQDQFSALSHHDLRLAHPSIQQWLQVPKYFVFGSLASKNSIEEQEWTT